MREIKFRLWYPPHKEMYYTTKEHTVWAGGNAGSVNSDSWQLVNTVNQYLMQYTGLKDKNGNEIYEGDILKFDRYWADHFNQECTKVFWFDEDSSFQFSHNLVDYTSIGVIAKESEVVGNIYENPELLIKGEAG